MRPPAQILGAAVLAVTSVLVLAPVALGQSADRTVGADLRAAPVQPADSLKAQEYWTAERMASAKPADDLVAGLPQPSRKEPEPAGPTQSMPPAAIGDAGKADQPSAITISAAVAVPRPYTNYPDRLNGKVFFTKAGGGNFVCSGTVVNSENKSIVWTAGHCVHGGRGGSFHTNWTFVPAYSSSSNGERPYGTRTARELWTRGEWASNSNLRQDFGAVVVNRLNGTRLVDQLGGNGITFNASRSQSWAAFGYPAAAPFSGYLQNRCNSGRVADDSPSGSGPATIKINCDMTGGASGGGWLINIQSSGVGYVNGLNSYKYSNSTAYMYGPYFGNEGLNLFNAVRNIAV